MIKQIIDPESFGVSFSIKQCRNFGLDPDETLQWLINEAGFRRFRLMSYWNEIEKKRGEIDVKQLDEQVALIAKRGGIISLCLGARQPRWPENHWPVWAWELPKPERDLVLYNFISAVVHKYKDVPSISSYQLENEALLKSFGERSEVDRSRLRKEYELVRAMDPDKEIIMSTSTSWGIPLRKPIPNLVGFSYYQVLYDSKNQRYSTAFHKPWLHKSRATLIRWLHGRPAFIHELQLEPWGPTAIWKMTLEEQDKSMGTSQIRKNLAAAKKVGAFPVDLWGGEWWYWRLKKHGDANVWNTVREELNV